MRGRHDDPRPPGNPARPPGARRPHARPHHRRNPPRRRPLHERRRRPAVLPRPSRGTGPAARTPRGALVRGGPAPGLRPSRPRRSRRRPLARGGRGHRQHQGRTGHGLERGEAGRTGGRPLPRPQRPARRSPRLRPRGSADRRAHDRCVPRQPGPLPRPARDDDRRRPDRLLRRGVPTRPEGLDGPVEDDRPRNTASPGGPHHGADGRDGGGARPGKPWLQTGRLLSPLFRHFASDWTVDRSFAPHVVERPSAQETARRRRDWRALQAEVGIGLDLDRLFDAGRRAA